ncbi:MAG: HPr(Ser) kinase/phosphatase [Firmicutes bacterium]|nr:HPr(Ser) kinase/phosphatase [Bacillota bacterium]MBR0105377.1 HPr(Ser) kinase/phosphatase [Bacillota bacterium]
MYSVSLERMVKENELRVLVPEIDMTGRMITRTEVSRPALQLAGFYEYFDNERVQILGKMEFSFLRQMEEQVRRDTIEKIFERRVPCVIVCKKLEPFPEMFEFAKKYDVPLLGSDFGTSESLGEIIRWLKSELAERITLHGVLVDVYGEGVLIMGESGIGKSEAALELIKRGHRLVADDAVIIRRISHRKLIGTCPEIIRHFIELRGIGIINVRQLFGVGAVKLSHAIDLIVRLEADDPKRTYDRLGIDEEYMDILGNKVVCLRIPVRPGRNLAVICETAAINHRQKRFGYNAAEDISYKINNSMY